MSARSLSAIADDMEGLRYLSAPGIRERTAAELLAEALSQWDEVLWPSGHKAQTLSRLLASYEALARSMGWRT